MHLKVTGHSMEPTLKEGDRVWASFFLRKPRKGDIVILHHPHRSKTLLVKRIAEELENKMYKVEGDNPNDSLNVETTPRKEIRAKVYLRYQPKNSRRRF